MKRLLTTWILTIAMIITFVPMVSFGAETGEGAGGTGIEEIATSDVEQVQEDDMLVCEGDYDTSKRKAPQRRGASNIKEKRIAAHTFVRELIDDYVDPGQYKHYIDSAGLTEEQINELTSVAEQATSECGTDYETIQTIYQFVADNIYYDYDGLNTEDVDLEYDAWVSKKTICSGYADLGAFFLNCLEIPCMKIIGYDHAYNAAYDSQNDRWVFFDATWGSRNQFIDGEMHYSGYNNTYFDMSIDFMSGLSSHEFVSYGIRPREALYLHPDNEGNVNYALSTPTSENEWPDITKWSVDVASPKDSSVEIADIGCSELRGMPISIRNDAFSGCNNLKKVSLPEGTTYIDNFAFENCSSLSDINIPSSITRIGKRAFFNCSSLTDVVIPEGVTEINEYTFYGCSKMESITIPGSVSSIGDYAFEGCDYLKGISLPEGLTSIGEYAFSECKSITGIMIPDSVTSIGKYAFNMCSNATECTIPRNIKDTGSGVFFGCSGLTSITIPESVTTIGNSAFSGCSGLTSITIPSNVTTIGTAAFRDCSGITSIIIPEGVNCIEGVVFSGCTNLKDISIPEGVTSIGVNAFNKCSSLRDITIPDSVTVIKGSAFSGCSGLTNIRIPENVTQIGNRAFYGCSGLTSITIPEGVTSIEKSTFQSCSGLKIIMIPESVTKIGESAFYGCSGLTSITIPEGVTSIEKSTFQSCSGLKSIKIPESVTKIGDSAFYGCAGLSSITIPENVSSFGKYAFYNCIGLESITLPKAVTAISNSMFSGCSGLKSITIPEGVTSIENYAFYNCANLERATIPNSVNSIGIGAFSQCPLITVYCNKDSYAHSYAVEKNIPFKILKSLQECDVSVEKEAYHTTGEPIKPNITVRDGDTLLTEDKQYQIIWSDAILGETSVTVKGLDNYYGSVALNYRIEDHDWNNEYTIDEQPTCKKEGSESIHCSVCDAVKEGSVKVMEKGPHDYGEWIFPEGYSCESGGTKSKVCAVCGDTISEEIPAAEHQWNDEYTVDRKATCTEDGEQSRYCAVCGERTDVQTITAPGHSFGEWTTVTPSTCVDPGLQQRRCTACGLTETEGLDLAAHEWEKEYTTDVAATCTEDGSESFHCKNCDAKSGSRVIPAGHKLTEHPTIAATVKQNGTRAYWNCDKCGKFFNDAAGKQEIAENSWIISKQAQPLQISPVKKTVKYSKVRKKAQIVTGAIKFKTTAQGAVTYKGVGTTAKAKKALKINAKTGKITVAKKTKKGTYKMKVTVTAAGTAEYKAGSKLALVTIKVR